MRASPLAHHLLVRIVWVAERRCAAGPAIGAPAATERSIARQVIGAGAGMAGGLVRGDALLDDLLANVRVDEIARSPGSGAGPGKNPRSRRQRRSALTADCRTGRKRVWLLGLGVALLLVTGDGCQSRLAMVA